MTLKIICAWCEADLGKLECPESGVTHGICQSCRSRLESERRQWVDHLAAKLVLEDKKQFKKKGLH
jgi:hypothetical protein